MIFLNCPPYGIPVGMNWPSEMPPAAQDAGMQLHPLLHLGAGKTLTTGLSIFWGRPCVSHGGGIVE